MGVIRGVLLLWAIAVAGAAAADAPFPGLVELTGGDFQATLQKLGADYDWVLAEFYAHWCAGRSSRRRPVLEPAHSTPSRSAGRP